MVMKAVHSLLIWTKVFISALVVVVVEEVVEVAVVEATATTTIIIQFNSIQFFILTC
jgi:hypothetical protein